MPRHGTFVLTNAQLKNLSGEAFTAPIAAMVLYSYWLNPWGIWFKPMGEQHNAH